MAFLEFRCLGTVCRSGLTYQALEPPGRGRCPHTVTLNMAKTHKIARNLSDKHTLPELSTSNFDLKGLFSLNAFKAFKAWNLQNK